MVGAASGTALTSFYRGRVGADLVWAAGSRAGERDIFVSRGRRRLGRVSAASGTACFSLFEGCSGTGFYGFGHSAPNWHFSTLTLLCRSGTGFCGLGRSGTVLSFSTLTLRCNSGTGLCDFGCFWCNSGTGLNGLGCSGTAGFRSVFLGKACVSLTMYFYFADAFFSVFV